MTRRILRLRITGLVQGVGYRAFVDQEARRLGLEGWVRNRRDRSVEAVVAGPGDAVTGPGDAIGEMIIACRRGPPGSQVDDVAITEAAASALAEGRPGGFWVLPTL